MTRKYIIDSILVAPTINLNGTAGEVLEKEYGEAYQALEDAIKAFRAIAPHGRDWQTQPDAAFDGARKSWLEHLQALEEIRASLMGVRISLRQQMEQRGK